MFLNCVLRSNNSFLMYTCNVLTLSRTERHSMSSTVVVVASHVFHVYETDFFPRDCSVTHDYMVGRLLSTSSLQCCQSQYDDAIF